MNKTALVLDIMEVAFDSSLASVRAARRNTLESNAIALCTAAENGFVMIAFRNVRVGGSVRGVVYHAKRGTVFMAHQDLYPDYLERAGSTCRRLSAAPAT